MNLEEFKELKIKCICNVSLTFIKHSNATYSSFSCLNECCSYYKDTLIFYKSFPTAINLIFESEVSIYGFVCNINYSNSIINSYSNDIFLDGESFINLLKLCDMNKYIEKYNNLILFK
jgi:hypothetical protein